MRNGLDRPVMMGNSSLSDPWWASICGACGDSGIILISFFHNSFALQLFTINSEAQAIATPTTHKTKQREGVLAAGHRVATPEEHWNDPPTTLLPWPGIILMMYDNIYTSEQYYYWEVSMSETVLGSPTMHSHKTCACSRFGARCLHQVARQPHADIGK